LSKRNGRLPEAITTNPTCEGTIAKLQKRTPSNFQKGGIEKYITEKESEKLRIAKAALRQNNSGVLLT